MIFLYQIMERCYYMSNIISLYEKINLLTTLVNKKVVCCRKHYIELAYEKRLIIEGTSKITLYFS